MLKKSAKKIKFLCKYEQLHAEFPLNVFVYHRSWAPSFMWEQCGLCLRTDAQQPSQPGDNLCWEATGCHTGESSIQYMSDAAVTAGRFSYQKKILERRLAEADGLSFASFRTTSMPPNSTSSLETFSVGSVSRGISINTLSEDKLRGQPLETPMSVSITLTGTQSGITAAVRWAERCVTPPAARGLADRRLHRFFLSGTFFFFYLECFI